MLFSDLFLKKFLKRVYIQKKMLELHTCSYFFSDFPPNIHLWITLAWTPQSGVTSDHGKIFICISFESTSALSYHQCYCQGIFLITSENVNIIVNHLLRHKKNKSRHLTGNFWGVGITEGLYWTITFEI